MRLAAQLLDPRSANGPETAALIDNATIHTLYDVGIEHLGQWPDSAETAVRILRKIAEGRRAAGGTAPWALDSLMWPQYVAKALLFRGHLRDAYETDRRLLLHPESSEWSAFLDPFLELSLFGVIPESIATATFARSLEPGTPWDSFLLPRALRGAPWWLARRDTASLSRLVRRAAEVGRRPPSPQASMRAHLLGVTSMAYLALARGDSAAALQQLEAIPDTLCLADSFGGTCVYAQLTLARLLGARGESRRSAELLERWRWEMSGSLISLATLELGRLAEAMGEREKAIQAYQFVVNAWRRADPELQPYVTEAWDALARLRKE